MPPRTAAVRRRCTALWPAAVSCRSSRRSPDRYWATDQGVYIEAADGTVLLAQAASVPVHPASVSKVPTTLALLRKLGPDYRFVTTFAASGPVHDGTIRG